MAPAAEDLLFGRIALHYKLVTREQLLAVAQAQARDGDRRRLGEILLAQGLLTSRQVEQILTVQRDYASKQGQAGGAGAPLAQSTDPLTPQAMPALTVQAMPELAVAPSPVLSAVSAVPAVPESATEPAATFDLDAPRALDRLLERALRVGASDLHVHSGSPMKIRVHGQMYDIEGGTLAARTAERLILEILTPEQLQALRDSGQVDFAYTLAGKGRFRSKAYRQQRGIDAVFRVIPPRPPSLTELGLPTSLARLSNYHQGMVLLT